MRKLIFIFLIVFQQGYAQIWHHVENKLTFSYVPNISNMFAIDSILYVSGDISKVNGVATKMIAQWNGRYWSTLRGGVTPPLIGMPETGVKYDNKIVMCGGFIGMDSVQGTQKIAFWNHQNWQPFPVPFNCSYATCEITSSLVYNGDLIICGGFPENNRIAKFDGTGWSGVGGGVTLNITTLNTMALFNNNLYVGGSFAQAGSTPAFNIARWDGSQWHDLDTGFSDAVTAMVIDTVNNVLYAGGNFHYAGGSIQTNGIAKWDGSQWYAMADSQYINCCYIHSLALYRGKLYTCGGFNVVGNDTLRRIARWNGTKWVQVAGGLNSEALCMTVFQDELYVGGYFNKAGTDSAYGIARYYEPPDSACLYFNPVILTQRDTFYLSNGTVPVHFYNNNNRADSWQWDFGDSGTDTVWHPTHTYDTTGNFTVSVTVSEAHCTKTATKNIVVLLGTNVQPIANIQQPIALRIYPNPASGSITIEIKTKDKEQKEKVNTSTTLSVTNAKGETMQTYELKEENNRIEINTIGWAKGTYLCNLVVGGKTVKVEKLVIE